MHILMRRNDFVSFVLGFGDESEREKEPKDWNECECVMKQNKLMFVARVQAS